MPNWTPQSVVELRTCQVWCLLTGGGLYGTVMLVEVSGVVAGGEGCGTVVAKSAIPPDL